MFKYKVYCGDYSLEGYAEDLTYTGTDRTKAFAAYKDAKEWMGMVRVEIIVLGREKEHYSRPDKDNFGLDELFADDEF